MTCFSADWAWFWVVIFIVFISWVVRKAAPHIIANRTDCLNHCISFKKGECHLYGKGHIAKSPCPDYYKHKIIKYNPEEDDE